MPRGPKPWPGPPKPPTRTEAALERLADAVEKIEAKLTGGGTGGGDTSELREILLRIEKYIETQGPQQAVIDQITEQLKRNNDALAQASKPT